MADETLQWNDEQLALIRSAICKDELDDEEFALFIETARRKGLDPIQKQVHAIKRWNKNLNKHVMTVQTGIDGYRLIARRDGLAGIDDPVFAESTTNATNPSKATVTVYRWGPTGEHKEAYTASAYWKEYYPGDGPSGYFWRKMPHGQLAKVAEALALRKGFQELSGLYITEEMQQSGGDDGAKPRPDAGKSSASKPTGSQKQAIYNECVKLVKEYRELVGNLEFEAAIKLGLGVEELPKNKLTGKQWAQVRDWLAAKLVEEEEGPDWMDHDDAQHTESGITPVSGEPPA